jgi:hypothetical protein
MPTLRLIEVDGEFLTIFLWLNCGRTIAHDRVVLVPHLIWRMP